MKNLIEAALQVMQECVGIDKSLTVGTGQNSYKGVGDKDVKLKIGESMRKHGLVIFPTGVEQKTSINQWEEQTQYGNKMKQSVFTEVVCTYTLFHKSGESVQLVGFGHGVDTQDKSAGKATTYALKNTLLYSFLVATGHIDDTDATHSDALPTPQKPAAQPAKQALTPTHEKWMGAVEALATGKVQMPAIEAKYFLTPEHRLALIDAAAEKEAANA
jgi:hypothetical protein